MKKKVQLASLGAVSLLVLTACGTGTVDANSSSLWERFVYLFAEMIRFLSFNGNVGVGIVLFTILIRTVLLPVFQFQMTSSRKLQEAQPHLRRLQEKYPGKDMESRNLLAQETQQLYKELGVNPYVSFLPLFIQLPVLLALFQALTRVEFLKVGHFLWLNIAEPDPYFILPILAAGFTFLSTWLSNKSLAEKNGATTAMLYLMPLMIAFFSFGMASGVALYWTVSNAYQTLQTLVLNNPFKIIAEREAEATAIKEKEARKKRALRKAQKKRK
ncbi:Inner membrane protein translocase component YidC [Streptococcus sp. DD10]|uniref:YidC/Oxa1 family membrane protein insertase n=1 Tax=Streptococcus sp. DD10 TaxID=1777878 RepID=UPI000792127D|nr:YidC/Oxa1 family membrane protein insertase [Streptococcus sp. DD10]KXT74486.1 Inner membrane protein translocase component YidC [Streptococcus sp. DD10]